MSSFPIHTPSLLYLPTSCVSLELYSSNHLSMAAMAPSSLAVRPVMWWLVWDAVNVGSVYEGFLSNTHFLFFPSGSHIMSRRPTAASAANTSTKKHLLAPVPFQASLLSVKGWADRLSKRKPNGVQPIEPIQAVSLCPLAWATNVLDAVPRTPGWMQEHRIQSRVAKLRQMLEHPSPHPLQRRRQWSLFIEGFGTNPTAATLVLMLATTDLS